MYHKDSKMSYNLIEDVDVNDGPLSLPEQLRLCFVHGVSTKDEQIEKDLEKIKKVIKDNPQYNIEYNIDGKTIIWNRLILPILTNYKKEEAPIEQSVVLSEYFPKDFKNLILDFAKNGNIPFCFEDEYYERFINDTKSCAPCINGTAGVGKSTILRNISKAIGVPVMKISKLGGLKYKDKNDLIGMQNPSVGVYAIESTPCAIYDRCPFNNIIWRIIMALFQFNDLDVMISKLCELLTSSINCHLIDYMKQFPVAIIVDSNIKENKERMKSRGLKNLPRITGCLFRCHIDTYCLAQNLTYYAFAILCKWPCVDVGKAFPLSGRRLDKFVHAIVTKCEINQSKTKSNLNISKIHHDVFQTPDYSYAKKLGVFK